MNYWESALRHWSDMSSRWACMETGEVPQSRVRARR
jgi:hypothetical protein